MRGPKGPNDPPVGGKVLDLRAKLEQMKQAKQAAGTTDVDGPDLAGRGMSDVHGDGYQPSSGSVSFEPNVDGERGGNLKARLQALGVKGAGRIKSMHSDQARTVDTPLGKILEGSVRAESAAGLQQLSGVVKAHEIGLQESRIKSADLLILGSLVEADRFTIEGSPTLQSTDALRSWERARSVYIGFNPALQRVVLPLKHVEVLIIEGNANLREIILPQLETVSRYLHIHDNTGLLKVSIGTASRPARIESFELKGNAQASYPGIHLL